MIGDVNLDGSVTVCDAILLSRVTSEDITVAVSKIGIANADVNNDGTIDSEDVSKMLRLIAKLE